MEMNELIARDQVTVERGVGHGCAVIDVVDVEMNYSSGYKLGLIVHAVYSVHAIQYRCSRAYPNSNSPGPAHHLFLFVSALSPSSSMSFADTTIACLTPQALTPSDDPASSNLLEPGYLTISR